MLLSNVLTAVFMFAILAVLPLRILAPGNSTKSGGSGWISVRISLLLICVFLVLMAVRSLGFGVDTAAYADFFREYCRAGAPEGTESSFMLSALLLNAGMAGACSVILLPAVWALLIVAGLLLMAAPLSLRLRYAALLTFSLVGVELATNALRQGLSVAVMMIAVSFWPRRRAVALACTLASVALHTSAALVVLGFGIASLPWTGFAIVFSGLVASVLYVLSTGIEPTLLTPFLYEIQKYLDHEADELWVRVLSFACVAGALLLPVASARAGMVRHALLEAPNYACAVRLSITCLPFLMLPYFGYRYIYGVYPLVLYLTLCAVRETGKHIDRHFALLLAFNAVLLLGWARGSSYMQEVPFFG